MPPAGTWMRSSRVMSQLGGVFTVLVCLLLSSACSNRKTQVPGKSCVLNSDCPDPLVCTYARCHEPCRKSSDCPAEQICGWAEAASGLDTMVRICLLDFRCNYKSDCPEYWVCGND